MKRILNTVLIIMLLINLLGVQAYAQNKVDFNTEEVEKSFNIRMDEGIILGEEAKLQISNLYTEVEITLPKGIKLIKGDLKSIDSSKNNKTHEIVIKIDEPGKYAIDVSSKKDGKIKKQFNISINENCAIYGENIGDCDLKIVEEPVKKDQSIKMEIIDPTEKYNISSEDIKTPKDLPESLQLKESGDIEEIDFIYDKSMEGDDLVEKNISKQEDTVTKSSRNSNLIAYDIVPLSSAPYMTESTYTFDFQYANIGDTVAYDVATGIYLNGSQVNVITRDMNPMTLYTARMNLTIHNPQTINLEMRVDEGSGDPDIRIEPYVWVSKIGKGIDYISLTTPNDSSPYEAKEPVMIQSFIRNVGTEETGDFDLTMYRDGEHLSDFTVPNIEVGKYKVIQINYTEHTQGDHTFRFVADEDHIVDSDIHEKYISGHWNGIGPDLIPLDLSYDGTGDPEPFSLENFEFMLKNNGTLDINTTFIGEVSGIMLVPLPPYNTISFQYTVDSLGANDSLHGTFSSYTTYQPSVFTHEVDIFNAVFEADEFNNIESYTIDVEYEPIDGVWFSQIEPDNWDATHLDKLFVPNCSIASKAHTPFEWNRWEHGDYENPLGLSPYENAGHINKWGCIAASLAMVLENDGAETEDSYYDLRTGITDNLNPDPFTITYANIGYPTIRNESGYYYIDSYEYSNSPVFMSAPNRGRSQVAGDFGYNIQYIDLDGKTEEEIVSIVTTTLAEHPEGIMARVSGSHTFVINNLNTDQVRATDIYSKELESMNNLKIVSELLTPELEEEIERKEQLMKIKGENSISIESLSVYDEYFIVTDPGTQQSVKGDNVVYDESWTYENYGGIQNLTYIEYIEKQ